MRAVKRRAYAAMVTIAVVMGAAGLSSPARRSATRCATPTASSARPGCGCRCCASARSSPTSCRARCGAPAAGPREFRSEARLLIREHWTRDRITLVVLGLICFYVTYVSYRNLKNFLPFVARRQGQRGRLRAAQVRPVAALRQRPGGAAARRCWAPTVSAHVLSWVYLIFLPMVPISVTIWLVWSRNVSFGYWFVTAQCICWTLGTASYYMIPTLGPNFAFPWLYRDLDTTGVTALQDALYSGAAETCCPTVRRAGCSRWPASRPCTSRVTLLMALVGAVHRAPPAHQDRAVGLHGHHGARHDVLRLALHRRRHRRRPDRLRRPSTSAASRPARSSTSTAGTPTRRPPPATSPWTPTTRRTRSTTDQSRHGSPGV